MGRSAVRVCRGQRAARAGVQRSPACAATSSARAWNDVAPWAKPRAVAATGDGDASPATGAGSGTTPVSIAGAWALQLGQQCRAAAPQALSCRNLQQQRSSTRATLGKAQRPPGLGALYRLPCGALGAPPGGAWRRLGSAPATPGCGRGRAGFNGLRARPGDPVHVPPLPPTGRLLQTTQRCACLPHPERSPGAAETGMAAHVTGATSVLTAPLLAAQNTCCQHLRQPVSPLATPKAGQRRPLRLSTCTRMARAGSRLLCTHSRSSAGDARWRTPAGRNTHSNCPICAAARCRRRNCSGSAWGSQATAASTSRQRSACSAPTARRWRLCRWLQPSAAPAQARRRQPSGPLQGGANRLERRATSTTAPAGLPWPAPARAAAVARHGGWGWAAAPRSTRQWASRHRATAHPARCALWAGWGRSGIAQLVAQPHPCKCTGPLAGAPRGGAKTRQTWAEARGVGGSTVRRELHNNCIFYKGYLFSSSSPIDTVISSSNGIRLPPRCSCSRHPHTSLAA